MASLEDHTQAYSISRNIQDFIETVLVFGEYDLLLNNIAWALRRFPVFPIFSSGGYPIRPVYAEDPADWAVAASSRMQSSVSDAAGPGTFTFEELLRLLAQTVGALVRLLHTPPSWGFALTRLAGFMLRAMVLTRDEVDVPMAGLLMSDSLTVRTTGLREWLEGNEDGLGRTYVSEIRRNFRQRTPAN